MGSGLNFETPEEIQRIQLDASNGPQAAGAAAPAAPTAKQTPIKKRRKLYTSDVWKHFKKGPEQPDGSYDGTCKYCGRGYKQGCQRSTSSMWHHFQKAHSKPVHDQLSSFAHHRPSCGGASALVSDTRACLRDFIWGKKISKPTKFELEVALLVSVIN